MKEPVLDIQACSIQDNLVFSGIPDWAREDHKVFIKNFLWKELNSWQTQWKTLSFTEFMDLTVTRHPVPQSHCGKVWTLQAKVKPRQGKELRGRNNPLPFLFKFSCCFIGLLLMFKSVLFEWWSVLLYNLQGYTCYRHTQAHTLNTTCWCRYFRKAATHIPHSHTHTRIHANKKKHTCTY